MTENQNRKNAKEPRKPAQPQQTATPAAPSGQSMANDTVKRVADIFAEARGGNAPDAAVAAGLADNAAGNAAGKPATDDHATDDHATGETVTDETATDETATDETASQADITHDAVFDLDALAFNTTMPDSKIAALEQQLANSQEQLQALEDKSTRLLAELENLRRRSAKDVLEARKFGVSKLAADIAQAADHLTVALGLLPPSMLPENQSSEKSKLSQLITGIIMTEKAILSTLEQYGVTRTLVKQGDPFDPNSHQALAQVESEEIAPNRVVQCHGNTYWLGDRLLRPAMVVVSTGTRAAAQQPDSGTSNGLGEHGDAGTTVDRNY